VGRGDCLDEVVGAGKSSDWQSQVGQEELPVRQGARSRIHWGCLEVPALELLVTFSTTFHVNSPLRTALLSSIPQIPPRRAPIHETGRDAPLRSVTLVRPI
jgi:hypothetical protein